MKWNNLFYYAAFLKHSFYVFFFTRLVIDILIELVSVDPLDGAMGVSAGRRLTIEEQQRELEKEPWFHGVISRAEAEALVVNVNVVFNLTMTLVYL